MTLSIPLVDPALPGLCIAQPTRAEPFLLDGERVRFVGSQTRAGGQVLFRDEQGGAGMTAGIRPDALGHAANLVLYPGVARRDFAGPGGSVVEAVVAARSLPFLAWQLSSSAANGARVDIDLATPSASPDVVKSVGGVVLTADGQELRLRVDPAPAELKVLTSGGGITVSLRLTDDDLHTLILSSGTPTAAGAAEQAAQHLAGHARQAARAEEDTLRTATGIEAVDEGLAWALSRTTRLVPDRVGAALGLGLASIALGHRGGAAAALSRLRSSATVEAGLLAARVGATTGDVRPAAEIAGELLSNRDAPDPGLMGVTAIGLADALQYGATPEVLAALRALGTPPHRPPAAESTGGGLSLPMAGSSRPSVSADPSRAAWLRDLLSGDPGDPLLVEDVRSSRARRAASAFRSDPDRAWADWRAVLDEGLVAGPAGPATWDDLTAPPGLADQTVEHPAAAAELILAFTQGMLGLAPDAPVGRLRLAPRMPTHLTSFAVEGIPIGDGTIRMAYERSGPAILFTLEPERIGVPPLLVFEPSVSGVVGSVVVDGDPADLDLRPDAGRMVVPVQLPLDSVRTVRITIG